MHKNNFVILLEMLKQYVNFIQFATIGFIYYDNKYKGTLNYINTVKHIKRSAKFM